jgi:fumarate hydratase class I
MLSDGPRRDALYHLICRSSTCLPADVVEALRRGREGERDGGNAAKALDSILENARLAEESARPICQDTGSLLFWVDAPAHESQASFREDLAAAIVRATEDGFLRQNCVATLSGRNTGNNLGDGSPCIHWREWDRRSLRVSIMLKGGGCENVGAQYSLPDTALGAGRDLAGVRACLLHAVVKAQGRGCAPGILGVCIGGDRCTGYAESKEQLLRPLDQPNSIPELDALERRVLAEANTLGIGPMGFSGKTTLLGVRIGVLHRIPASYFVTVSYMCWACRRYTIML